MKTVEKDYLIFCNLLDNLNVLIINTKNKSKLQELYRLELLLNKYQHELIPND